MRFSSKAALVAAVIAVALVGLVAPHRGLAGGDALAAGAGPVATAGDAGVAAPYGQDQLSTITASRLLSSARLAARETPELAKPGTTIASSRVIDGPRVLLSLAGPGATSNLVFDPFSGSVTPAAAGPDPNNLWLKDFFPVADGYVWNYHDANTQEKFKILCHGQQATHGVQAWNMERTRPWPESDFDLIEVGAQAIRLHHRHIVPQANQASDMDLDPAAVFSDAKVTIGKIYVTEPHQINPATGNTTIWTSRVEALEPMTVPAGTFQCLRIHLTIKDSKLGTRFAEVQMHYGYKTGLVRRNGQFFGVFFYELLDSHNIPAGI